MSDVPAMSAQVCQDWDTPEQAWLCVASQSCGAHWFTAEFLLLALCPSILGLFYKVLAGPRVSLEAVPCLQKHKSSSGSEKQEAEP